MISISSKEINPITKSGAESCRQKVPLSQSLFQKFNCFQSRWYYENIKTPKHKGEGGVEEGVIAISTEKELKFLVFTIKGNFLCFAPVNCKKL